MVDDRVVKSADFIYALNHSIFSALCLVLVRAPHQSCDTSQILLAGLPDGFSRESPVFCFVFYLFIFFIFFYYFFATHSFVISHARKGDNKTITHTYYMYILHKQRFVQKDRHYIACIARLMK